MRSDQDGLAGRLQGLEAALADVAGKCELARAIYTTEGTATPAVVAAAFDQIGKFASAALARPPQAPPAGGTALTGDGYPPFVEHYTDREVPSAFRGATRPETPAVTGEDARETIAAIKVRRQRGEIILSEHVDWMIRTVEAALSTPSPDPDPTASVVGADYGDALEAASSIVGKPRPAASEPRKMAEGCCSAVSPCSHQQRDPYSICEPCRKAAEPAAVISEGATFGVRLDGMIRQAKADLDKAEAAEDADRHRYANVRLGILQQVRAAFNIPAALGGETETTGGLLGELIRGNAHAIHTSSVSPHGRTIIGWEVVGNGPERGLEFIQRVEAALRAPPAASGAMREKIISAIQRNVDTRYAADEILALLSAQGSERQS